MRLRIFLLTVICNSVFLAAMEQNSTPYTFHVNKLTKEPCATLVTIYGEEVGKVGHVLYFTSGPQIEFLDSTFLGRYYSAHLDQVALLTSFARVHGWENKGIEKPAIDYVCDKLFSKGKIKFIIASTKIFDFHATEFKHENVSHAHIKLESQKYMKILLECGFMRTSRIAAPHTGKEMIYFYKKSFDAVPDDLEMLSYVACTYDLVEQCS